MNAIFSTKPTRKRIYFFTGPPFVCRVWDSLKRLKLYHLSKTSLSLPENISLIPIFSSCSLFGIKSSPDTSAMLNSTPDFLARFWSMATQAVGFIPTHRDEIRNYRILVWRIFQGARGKKRVLQKLPTFYWCFLHIFCIDF